MSTQEIQIITSTIEKLGASGKETMLWWILAADVFQPLVVMSGLFAIVYIITKTTYKYYTKQEKYYEQLKAIGRVVGFTMDFYSSEMEAILRWVQLGKEKEKEK